jgi:SAM-dependent methyltransferase
MPRGRPTADWPELLASWDRQQTSFMPSRERRFEAMLDVLEAALPPRFTALDIGCGPGSLSERILTRFPRARTIAVDFDPVLLRLGERSHPTLRGRIRWVDVDITSAGWMDSLPARRVDAVVSTTALHWLEAKQIKRLYQDIGRLVRPGGVFLNGDYLPWSADRRTLRRLADGVRTAKAGGKDPRVRWEKEWNRWWKEIAQEPALKTAFHARQARGYRSHPHHDDLPLNFHKRALRKAGFHEVAVVWQRFENRVLLGVR